MSFTLTTPAFKEGETIPTKYTCVGRNVSPPLQWSPPPQKTKSLVLIADDPDAPVGTWVHWVLFNIPFKETQLPEGVPPKGTFPKGARQGLNDFKRVGYGGPCPPPGRPHRYFFKLYALDTLLNLKSGTKKSQVLEACQGHILADTQLMGRFGR